MYSGLHGIGLSDQVDRILEAGNESVVVLTQTDQCLHLFFSDRNKFRVVVALVHTARDPDGLAAHAFQCELGAVHIGGFRVVDVLHTVDAQNAFKTMGQALKIREGISDRFFPHLEVTCGNGRSH